MEFTVATPSQWMGVADFISDQQFNIESLPMIYMKGTIFPQAQWSLVIPGKFSQFLPPRCMHKNRPYNIGPYCTTNRLFQSRTSSSPSVFFPPLLMTPPSSPSLTLPLDMADASAQGDTWRAMQYGSRWSRFSPRLKSQKQ